MTHIDPDLLADLALGERRPTAAEQRHLTDCGTCHGEIARLTGTVRSLRDSGAEILLEPPSHVWLGIAEEAGLDSLTASTSAYAPAPTSEVPARKTSTSAWKASSAARANARGTAKRRRAVRPGVLGLVAGVLIGLCAATGIWNVTHRAPQTPTAATISLAPLPQFPQWKQASGFAQLQAPTGGADTITVTVHAPSGDGFFEVWLLGRDGVSMISLGDLGTGASGSFTVPPGTNLSFYSRIDVSLQAFDGRVQHSATSVVRGTLPAALTSESG
jgi:hypothetical protein